MKILFKQSINSKQWLKLFLIIGVIYIIAFMGSIFLDGEKYSYYKMMASIVSQFSQFGFLAFPIFYMQNYQKDYENMNIIFYKRFKLNQFTYWIYNVIIDLIWTLVAIIIYNTIVSIYYNDFTFFINFIWLNMMVMIQYIILFSLLGVLIKKTTIAFIISLFYWIITLLISQKIKKLEWVSMFDIKNSFSKNLHIAMDQKKWINLEDIFHVNMYILILTLISVVVVVIHSKFWLKKGL